MSINISNNFSTIINAIGINKNQIEYFRPQVLNICSTTYFINSNNKKYVIKIPNKDNYRFQYYQKSNIKIEYLLLQYFFKNELYYYDTALLSYARSFIDHQSFSPWDEKYEKLIYKKKVISSIVGEIKKIHNYKYHATSKLNPLPTLDSENHDYDKYTWLTNLIIKKYKDDNVCIIHNDLNPNNYIYDSIKNKIYLIDFESSMLGSIYIDIALYFLNMYYHKKKFNYRIVKFFYKQYGLAFDKLKFKNYMFYCLYRYILMYNKFLLINKYIDINDRLLECVEKLYKQLIKKNNNL